MISEQSVLNFNQKSPSEKLDDLKDKQAEQREVRL